ncbi:MAG TPA: hypothetical protein VFE54_10620 [Mucilaginibacter sp.]|jgi:hypothetical protein|nr:hypothetical protein [Mucilaginibacter sp.]
MEVHHHPEVEKKGFKEYLLEGLMIFLAVLMGFIAENIREGISERKRTAEFAQSYYESIKKDTALLHAAIRFSGHKIAACDSSVAMLHLPVGQQKDTVLYREVVSGTNVFPFHSSSGSYDQIKSSGSLRFFKQKLARLMNEYDLQAREVVNREDIDLRFITDKYIPLTIHMVNIEAAYDFRFGNKTTHELYFTDRSIAATREWINHIMIVKLLRMRSMQEYNKLLEVSGRVLAELKQEYNLEDE